MRQGTTDRVAGPATNDLANLTTSVEVYSAMGNSFIKYKTFNASSIGEIKISLH
jgi:hypothetical protein